MTFSKHSAGTDHFNATYGAAAASILDHLNFLYRRRSCVEVFGWDTATHENGLVILLPTSSVEKDQAALNTVDPAGAFAVAAARTYEAFSAEYDMDDEEQAKLPNELLQAAQTAQLLAVAT
ncbi:hypothetical protein H8F21_14640 [Pseudomonas sp. P66]|uniref:Uncharacterized protein n=1 Tax=Pseudomonas arcuscaelestis TaxID=2710591 RepID=A0ABS2BYV6_9PSED|nr:hypothetical protein [Pseudomonas arcuscaelestis]MBM5458803.1 hypothetical protein [Pseudomonas arcuscaelestis]